jgi:HEAT repeat protein
LTREKQSVYDFLNDVKIGGQDKRWQAAFELSKILANPKLVPEDSRFVNEMISAYKSSEHDTSLLRQYLALAMGRTGKKEFVPVLIENLPNEKEENIASILYALGMIKDEKAASAIREFVNHENPRIRSIAVVSLGNIGDYGSKEILKKALNDSEPNVQWGSALALGNLKDASGKAILLKLLHRDFYKQFPEVDANEQNNLMINAIYSAGQLEEKELDIAVTQLAASDKNMNVRSAAMNYRKKN